MVLPMNSYSLDLPIRCLDLLNHLLPIVQQDEEFAARHGGPLTTTLTLALATPMLTIPIERIQKHQNEDVGYANDRGRSQRLAERIDAATRGKKLADHPQLEAFDWAYLSKVEPFNIADGLSDDLAALLDAEEARHAARRMDFSAFLSCLRNALSHGGILYLNKEGRTTPGQASMLCLVSAKPRYPRVRCEKRDYCPPGSSVTESLRLLRISETGFREFLLQWVAWLHEAGLKDLAAR
ncbi:hypothetical protein [Ensifer aridi]|uniref:hypothetical protein n=1 Tax=Ensifer aridi TaxID=1708715 RepID=UPI0009BED29C|nr:hypothetical protein [Ensifer aridi]